MTLVMISEFSILLRIYNLIAFVLCPYIPYIDFAGL